MAKHTQRSKVRDHDGTDVTFTHTELMAPSIPDTTLPNQLQWGLEQVLQIQQNHGVGASTRLQIRSLWHLQVQLQ